MGEGTAVLQAVNSLRNEENNFTQEDEICLKGDFSCNDNMALHLVILA